MNLGKNIKVIRTTKNISQKELAKILGITPNYLSMIENSAKKPSLNLIERLATALEVPLGVIFSELSLY